MNRPVIEILTIELVRVFTPLQKLDNNETITSLIKELGWQFPEGVELNIDVQGLINSVESLIEKVSELAQAQKDEEKLRIALEILEDVKYLINEINEVVLQIKTAIEDIPDFLGETADMITTLLKRLLDYLIYIYCQRYHPRIFAVLHVLGILEIVEDSVHMPIKTVQWDRIPRLFFDQQSIFKSVYNWNNGNENIYSDEFFLRLEVFMRAFLLPGGIYTQKDSIREGFGRAEGDNKEIRMPIFQGGVWPESYMELDLNICPIPHMDAIGDKPEKKAGIAIYPYPYGLLEIAEEIAENWILTQRGEIDLNEAGLCLKLRAPANLDLITDLFTKSPLENLNLSFEIGLIRTSSPDSMIYIFGQEKGSYLALKEAGIKFKATSQRDTTEVSGMLNVKDFTIAINPGADGDGFIQKLLSGINIKSVSELGIGVSNLQGIFFEGSSALEIKIPTHLELGPINIDSSTVGVSIDNSDFRVLLASDFSVGLGPLFCGVEEIGLTIPLSFPGNGGNLGPVQISAPKFKPPKGVALSIDAEVVKGAGYLRFEPEHGEYSGALELTFQDFLSLKAIGLINTKMPDGSAGFSMLIIITAEFTIQIGMGFVFLGAGGLLGLHRTANLDALAKGVRSGATANILFPQNIVENATQIISDIKTFFPVQQNYFLIGPMIKLGYGQPPLISLMLGVIVEIKTDNGGNLERIAILGVLKCILPEEKAAILVLQVNFIGAIDFRKKTGFFFASIFQSRVLAITIEGEMGLLVAWGNDSNFVVSVGGFHPRFSPPPLPFPVPKRVSLSILNKSWGKIRVEGYFAVTTNTVQFGAKIELKFGMDEFKIEGHLGFDVLFQFDPFFFVVEISGKVSLKVFGAGLFSITAKFSLEGPTPWRAKGYGKVKILFITFKARFDKKWGSSKNTKLPRIKVLAVLEREFSHYQNWEAIAPASNKIMVSVRELPEPATEEERILIFHPVGKLKASQRAVPLKIKIDKLGNQKPSDANFFELYMDENSPVKFDGEFKESFPPGHYFNMNNSKKLSEKATRKYVGGQYIIPKTGETKISGVVVRHVRYELITIDEGYKREKEKCYKSLELLFTIFLRNNAAARSVRSQKRKKMAQPFNSKINVTGGNYTVANVMDNQPYNVDSKGFETQWEAEAFISGHPEAAGQLHVIPTNEANFMAL